VACTPPRNTDSSDGFGPKLGYPLNYLWIKASFPQKQG